MPKLGFALAALLLSVVALTACTDWDAGVNGNIAVSNPPPGADDVDHTGLVWWETQGTNEPDATGATDTATEDASAGTDDVLVVEILGEDATASDATVSDASDGAAETSGPDGLIAPDGVLDGANACAGTTRPIGCACVNSQECASGLCVLGATGLVCSPTCKTIACPSGWECSSPAMVCKLAADAAAVDASAPDAVADDTAVDGGSAGDTAVDGGSAGDAAPFDVAAPDTTLADAAAPDSAVWDAQVSDLTSEDAGSTDALADSADAQIADGQVPDLTSADAVSDAAADVDTDGLTGLDWQGYPDADFPADADIYGGAINSCLSLYLYQQETCGANNPTAACIDSVASQGSLYANYLFEPVRACQDAYCVDLCATATDTTCMNQCIGKNCPNQFLSCVSNDQQGTADCQATFSCAMGYPGKLLTIGAKCYANGTLDAQLQVGGLISCETKPNTQSCFAAIGNCYDQGAAATNTCMQTVTCTQNCAGVQECVWQCLGKASPTGRQAIDALGTCMVTVCTPKCNGDQNCQNTCLSTDCSAQFGTCMAN